MGPKAFKFPGDNVKADCKGAVHRSAGRSGIHAGALTDSGSAILDASQSVGVTIDSAAQCGTRRLRVAPYRSRRAPEDQAWSTFPPCGQTP